MKASQVILLSVAASFAVAITGCNDAPSNSQSGANTAPPAASQSGANPAPPATVAQSASVPLKSLDAKVLEGAKAIVNACALDQVNGSPPANPASIKKGGDVMFTGWASDEKLNTPAEVTLVLEGAQVYGATIPTGQPRPDVAKALSSEGLANSGFSAPIDISAAAPGDYKVAVLMQESDGPHLCNINLLLTISN